MRLEVTILLKVLKGGSIMNENFENEVIYEDGDCESKGLGLGAKLLMAAGGGLIAGAAAGFGFAKKKYDKITVGRIDRKSVII